MEKKKIETKEERKGKERNWERKEKLSKAWKKE